MLWRVTRRAQRSLFFTSVVPFWHQLSEGAGSLYVLRRTVDLSGHVGRPHEHNERHGKQPRAHTLPMTVSYIEAIHKGKLSFQDKYKYKSYLHNPVIGWNSSCARRSCRRLSWSFCFECWGIKIISFRFCYLQRLKSCWRVNLTHIALLHSCLVLRAGQIPHMKSARLKTRFGYCFVFLSRLLFYLRRPLLFSRTTTNSRCYVPPAQIQTA